MVESLRQNKSCAKVRALKVVKSILDVAVVVYPYVGIVGRVIVARRKQAEIIDISEKVKVV